MEENLKLKELAAESEFTYEQQAYFLAHIKQIGASEFVGSLCQVAYDIGFEDGAEAALNWEDGE